MDMIDDMFGGNETAAQEGANSAAKEYVTKQGEQARDDLLKLFGASDENRNMGYQGSLDVMGQAMPQQLSAFQQGNTGAQQTIINSMPQYENAIMGRPVDYDQFRSQRVAVDPSYMQQNLPSFITNNNIGLRQPEQGTGLTPDQLTPEQMSAIVANSAQGGM